MKRARAILSAGLLSTGVLLAGCAVDAGDETSDEATAEAGAPIISYDAATGTYRIEAGTLDAGGFPYSVFIDQEMRGTLDTPDDVLEVGGFTAEGTIAFLPTQEPREQLEAGESVDLNACGWVPVRGYECGTEWKCFPVPVGPPYCREVPKYCPTYYLWMCS